MATTMIAAAIATIATVEAATIIWERTSALFRFVYIFVLGGKRVLQLLDRNFADSAGKGSARQTGRRRFVLPMGGDSLLAPQLMVEQMLTMNR
jgi:hypothetical protein